MNATFKIKHSKSKGMQEKESNMSVRCTKKIPSLGITVCITRQSLVIPNSDPQDGIFYLTSHPCKILMISDSVLLSPLLSRKTCRKLNIMLITLFHCFRTCLRVINILNCRYICLHNYCMLQTDRGLIHSKTTNTKKNLFL